MSEERECSNRTYRLQTPRCKHCGRDAGPDGVCPVCAELDCWPPLVTRQWTLRELAAGRMVALEAIGRDFRRAECPHCPATCHEVDGDPHGTLFQFGVGGAYKHRCWQPDPTEHPGSAALDRQARDGEQRQELSMYTKWGRDQ